MSYKTSTYSIELVAQQSNGNLTKNTYNYRGLDQTLTAVERYMQFNGRPFKSLDIEVRRDGVPFLKATHSDGWKYHSLDTLEFPEEQASRLAGEVSSQGVSDYSRRILDKAEEEKKVLENRLGEYVPDYELEHLRVEDHGSFITRRDDKENRIDTEEQRRWLGPLRERHIAPCNDCGRLNNICGGSPDFKGICVYKATLGRNPENDQAYALLDV